MREQLSAHAQLTSGAIARYKSSVDDVTRLSGRFERHLAETLNTSWLTFPNTLLNLSLAANDADERRISREQSASERTLLLATLLQIDETQVIYSWTHRFWTRSVLHSLFDALVSKIYFQLNAAILR